MVVGSADERRDGTTRVEKTENVQRKVRTVFAKEESHERDVDDDSKLPVTKAESFSGD